MWVCEGDGRREGGRGDTPREREVERERKARAQQQRARLKKGTRSSSSGRGSMLHPMTPAAFTTESRTLGVTWSAARAAAPEPCGSST